MKRFGEKLRALRIRAGISQAELGSQLEVDQSYIGRLEKGTRTPNVALILKIVELFGVTSDELIRDDVELS